MTCVGGQLGPWLLRALRACNRIRVHTVGIDSRPDALGKSFADVFYQAPLGDDPGYPEWLLDICRRENVDVVLPTSDEEALALALYQEEFASVGIKISCPPAAMAAIMRNKADMYEHLSGLGLAVPEYHRVENVSALRSAAEALGYPERDFVVKPTVARGGRGVWVISDRVPTMAQRNQGLSIDALNLENYLASAGSGSIQELMAMPLLSGDMFDIDVLANAEGNPYYLIPRHRYHVRTTPFRGCWLDPHPGVSALVQKTQTTLRLPYLFDYDVILDAQGQPWILEVNPRMSGSVSVSVMHGVNLIEFIVLMLLGKDVPDVEIPWGQGAKPFIDLVPVAEKALA